MNMSNILCLIKSFSFTMLNRLFCYSFDFFYNKKSCLSVCGGTTTYRTAMCDMLLEREFHYQL